MAASLKLLTILKFSKLIPLKGNVVRNCAVLGQKSLSTSRIDSSSENTLAQQFKRAIEAKNPKHTTCRTPQSDPTAHTVAHEGLFYTIPEDDVKQWLENAFSPKDHRMAAAFQEMLIMVRRPALEVLECMRVANYNLPVLRYIFYGYYGCGKSLSLGHVMHSCAREGWLLLHVPWAATWNRYYRESQVSSYNATRFDQPMCGMAWLTHFKKINEQRLKELDIRLENRYVWNKREAAEVGSTLVETIEFGLSRTKYACDVIGAVLKEVRQQAAGKGAKVLVAVDGVNAFWEMSMIRRVEDKSSVASKDLTLTHNFMKMLRNDWAGGAVVCTADASAGRNFKDTSSYLPLHLLHKEGFEWMDPFIPVNVPAYSDMEVRSNIELFIEKKWLQNPHALTEDGKKELIFLSCNNPRVLYSVTRAW